MGGGRWQGGGLVSKEKLKKDTESDGVSLLSLSNISNISAVMILHFQTIRT